MYGKEKGRKGRGDRLGEEIDWKRRRRNGRIEEERNERRNRREEYK